MALKTQKDFGKHVGKVRWLGRDLTLFPKGKPCISADNTTINNKNNDIATNLTRSKRSHTFPLRKGQRESQNVMKKPQITL